MKKVCVVQARMGNSRLPGKNGLLLLGTPQIWHVLNRITQATAFSEIILALPHESNGGVLKEAAQSLDIPVLDYKGDYNDVLHRYVLAADIMDADIVIRIPGDNTFVDPGIVDATIAAFDEEPFQWNHLWSSLDDYGVGHPAGLGCEVWDVRLLQWMDKNVREKRYREHPHKWLFTTEQISYPRPPVWLDYQVNPYIPLKFSMDTQDEWEWTKEIYGSLYPDNPNFTVRDVLRVLKERHNVK
jgi:spore coat polysaccharide biosynthesis protein SpsF